MWKILCVNTDSSVMHRHSETVLIEEENLAQVYKLVIISMSCNWLMLQVRKKMYWQY